VQSPRITLKARLEKIKPFMMDDCHPTRSFSQLPRQSRYTTLFSSNSPNFLTIILSNQPITTSNRLRTLCTVFLHWHKGAPEILEVDICQETNDDGTYADGIYIFVVNGFHIPLFDMEFKKLSVSPSTSIFSFLILNFFLMSSLAKGNTRDVLLPYLNASRGWSLPGCAWGRSAAYDALLEQYPNTVYGGLVPFPFFFPLSVLS
jgi:hypothetical protein